MCCIQFSHILTLCKLVSNFLYTLFSCSIEIFFLTLRINVFFSQFLSCFVVAHIFTRYYYRYILLHVLLYYEHFVCIELIINSLKLSVYVCVCMCGIQLKITLHDIIKLFLKIMLYLYQYSQRRLYYFSINKHRLIC